MPLRPKSDVADPEAAVSPASQDVVVRETTATSPDPEVVEPTQEWVDPETQEVTVKLNESATGEYPVTLSVAGRDYFFESAGYAVTATRADARLLADLADAEVTD